MSLSPLPPPPAIARSRDAFAPGQPVQLELDGWAGRISTTVSVVEVERGRVRIRAIVRTKLAGRARWLEAGNTAWVPLHALRALGTQHDSPVVANQRRRGTESRGPR